jgi:hypothetical protein
MFGFTVAPISNGLSMTVSVEASNPPAQWSIAGVNLFLMNEQGTSPVCYYVSPLKQTFDRRRLLSRTAPLQVLELKLSPLAWPSCRRPW